MTNATTPADAPPMEGRPVPLLDASTRPYWEATLRGELLVQECPECSHRQFYPRQICVECGAVPGWLTTAGRGVVHTFSVVRQNGAFPFNQWTPYAVAVVELDEGPRIMGNVIGCEVDEVRIGMRVEVGFVPLNDEASLPFWRPAD
ncbi:Zn-ribbon domain-containing OB-fold protein [Streptosporangium sp. NPDC000509]|uniref:Zn-ribbon domain-containing OB-fold protein n=1 Tax=Streptosporangium sp. NPDC000509 TaxID=3366186 RepID=UPI0036C6FBCD